MPRDSFILYTEHGQIIQKLDDAQAGRLLKGIMLYEAEEALPELDAMTDIVFTTIRIRLDRDAEAYDKKCAERSEAASNAAKERWKKEHAKACESIPANPNACESMPSMHDTDTGTDTDTDIDTGTDTGTSLKKRRSSFIPPTLKEVEAYAKEIGSTVDPGHFLDYYTAIGWTAGGTRIVDWKAKFRNWSNGGRNRSAGNVGPNGVAILPENEQLHDLDGIIN